MSDEPHAFKKDSPNRSAKSDDIEWLALAIERDRQLETGEVQPISHGELMARLRAESGQSQK